MLSRYILLSFLLVLLLISCSKGDADCTVLISGQVKDALTGLPIDSIEVKAEYSEQIFGQAEEEPVMTYSDFSGNYVLEVGCHTIPSHYRIWFIDRSTRNYAFRHISRFLLDTDDQQDVLLCPNTGLKVKLNRISEARSIEFRFSGNHCDDNSYSYHNAYEFSIVNDSDTKLFNLPVSSNVKLEFKSKIEAEIEVDTSIYFATIAGDTVEIALPF